MSGVLLALAASLSWGFADFAGGLGSRRLALPLVLAVSQTAGLVLVAIVVPAAGEPVPSAGRLAWGAFAGAAGVVGLACFYRALAVGTMAVVGPISATAAVVPLVYGLVRGDRPSALQAVGVVLAFGGVVAASTEPASERAERAVAAGVGFALVAVLGFGSSLLGLNRAAQGGALWATLTLRLTGVPLVLLAALALRPSVAGLRRHWPLLLGCGLADTGANLLYGLASTRGLLSVVSVLGSLYPIVLAILARLVLAERLARTQLAGVAVALAGVALIGAG